MRQFKQEGLVYYKFDSFDDLALDHAIFSRIGGNSQGPYSSMNLGGTNGDNPKAVVANHEKLFQVFGRPYSSRFDVWQVHGKTILFSDAPRPPEKKHPPADGIFTDKPEVTLIMRFADCVPIFLVDPKRRVYGLAHAGWQGTVKRTAASLVDRFVCEYGSHPAELVACIGPSIGPDHYEIGPDVIKQVQATFGGSADNLLLTSNGDSPGSKVEFDLWQANCLVLEQAGVKQVEVAGICTACNVDDWYSHRAEAGRTGRFGALIGL